MAIDGDANAMASLADLDPHDAEYLTESDYDSEPELPSSASSLDSDREVNQATLKQYAQDCVTVDDRGPSPRQLKNQESDRIIDKAREYQQELFERAREENIIAVLDTGSGKTLIAALLIRHFLQQELIDRSLGKPPKIVFFLVNSVHLARQQARFLDNNLPQNVIPLFGDSSDDLWRRAEWARIFADNSVVVCTADVLNQCLMHTYLKIRQISLLIFDEAHHCKKNHPYSRIIRDYYLKSKDDKPRIFGMTASPADSKRDIIMVVEELEELLQSKIVTTKDLSVFDFAPRAQDVTWTYPPLHPEYDTDLHTQLHPLCGFIGDLSTYFRFSRLASRQLGTWAADRIWKYGLPAADHEITSIIRKFERSTAYSEMTDKGQREMALNSVQEAVSIVKNHYFGSPRLDAERELSPKVRYLYDELNHRFSASATTRAIVFVEERLAALVLCDLFESLKLTNLRPGVLVGAAQSGTKGSSWKDQESVMENFRAGIINIIFATSAAEEGIDIPQCNLVVRFDLYKTPIQYTQSRGRARMKDSIFAHMVEKGNQSQVDIVDYAIQQDEYIRMFCQQLPSDRLLGQGSKLKQIMARDASCQSFITSSGVIANYTNALILLSRYADSLKKIGAASAEVYEEVIDVEENMFRYKVILPPTDDERTTAVKGAKGDARTNKVLARRSAAWHCCYKLRKAGLLDENLDSIFVKVKPQNLNARTAVSERKDDYDKKLKPDFWFESGAGSSTLPTRLFVTHVIVGPKPPSSTTEGVLLLTRAPLPNMPSFPVFVENNIEKHISFNRLDQPVIPTPDQLEALTAFTLNGVFNDIFNKTYAHDSKSMSYWLAPPALGELKGSFERVVNMDELLVARQAERQRWKPVRHPADMGEYVMKWCNAFLVDPGNGKFHYFSGTVLPGKSICDPPPDDIKGVQKRHKDTIIEFTDSTWGGKKKDPKSFVQRYDPNQPVLKAKLVMAGRNFLEKCPEDQQRHAECHIAPQPLEVARVSPAMAQICQLWPSVLHRLEAYLVVAEAFNKLDLNQVPLDLALEAFTQDSTAGLAEFGDVESPTQHEVDDGFSTVADKKGAMNYERLEFIGDSLLKMMTTITIFNRTTCNEEGMHCKRMDLLSNSRLCRTASAPHYELYRYIRSPNENWRNTWYPEGLELKKGRIIKLTDKDRKHALGKKTIADVCEATIGACIMTSQHLPTEQKFDLGIKAITKLVEDDNHAINSWKEVAPMYKPGQWSLRMNDPVANDLARKVYQITCYRFKKPCLLRSAFTHSSDQTSTVQDLQRLEFLGDACFDWVCIWWLFSTNPTRNPQWLTEHKMAMVSNKFLAALAVVLGFNKLLYASTPAVYDEIGSYATKVKEAWGKQDVKPDFWTRVESGSTVPKALADLVESYLGAVLVDSGFDFREIEKFFEKHVKWFFEDIEAYDTFANRHPTTHLFRLLREEFRCRKSSPEVIESSLSPSTTRDGEDDDGAGDEAVTGIKVHVAWFVHGKIVAASSGQGAKYAKVRASRAALKKLGKLKVDEFRKEWECDCVRKGKKKEQHEENEDVNGELGKITEEATDGT